MSTVLLLQMVAKGFVVLGATWLVALCMRRSSASARHLVWTVGVAATLALPLVRVIGPTWTVAVNSPAWSAVTAPHDVDALAPVPVRIAPAPRAQAAAVDVAPAPVPPSVSSGPSFGIWDVTLALWLLGAIFLLARLTYGLLRARWLAERAAPVEDEGWLHTFDAAAAALRVEGPVRLRQSPLTSIPVACGIWRSSILLPADALTWSAERRLVVLLHELAHVRRRDCLVQVMAQAARALHWVNPLAHVALVRLRAEQERACDDLVLAAGTDAPAYADHLFEIARSFRTTAAPAWATLAMARPSQLEGRLMAILDDRLNRAPLARRARLACAGGATAVLVTLGALHVTAAVPASTSPNPAVAPNPVPVPDPDPDPTPVPTPDAAPAPKRMADAQQAQSPAPPQPPRATTPSSDSTSTVTEDTRRRVADALATALTDENVDVRQQALNGLASMRDARAVPALLSALRDPNADLRALAVSGLAQFDSPEARNGLVSALKDSSPDVRRRAAVALGRIADPSTIDALTVALKDQDAQVRERAAIALAQIARGQRRGPTLMRPLPGAGPVPPLPPVPPGKPLVKVDIDQKELARITKEALDSVKDLRFDFDLR